MSPVGIDVAAEFPELALCAAEIAVPGGDRHSPPELVAQLATLSDRLRGPQAVTLRTKPIPHAYRAFFRHIGLDPDRDRIPVEALVVERLRHGGFQSHGRVRDAITIAVMETGVGVWAADAEHLTPDGLEIVADPGGRLVVRSADGTLVAPLFGDVAAEYAPGPKTERLVLYAVVVPGVDDLVVEEAFWLVEEALAG